MNKTRTVRVSYVITGTVNVQVDEEDLQRLIEDEPSCFDPEEYGIDCSTILTDASRGSGDFEVDDWDVVDQTVETVDEGDLQDLLRQRLESL